MEEQFDPDGEDEVLDLCEKNIHKLEKCGNGNTQCLLLDKNELTRLENVESYGDLKKLSVADNKLVRMYGVCRVLNLRVLNLENNCIVAIEGLRDLIHLKWLKLAGNKIKAIEHLNSNIELEYLDLSRNCISSLVNLSHLKVLHTFLLDANYLKNLNGATSFLPTSLVVVNISNNSISDLNQISFLGHLCNLEQLSISNNPCIDLTRGAEIGFDYRPFVINWCQNLKLLDGFIIGAKESLKAEWLYSMGKGRHFQVGEHAELLDYLASVCPLTTAENLMTEEDAKLNLILTKQRQHQRQLEQEMSASVDGSLGRPVTAPLMTSSYHESSHSQFSSPVFLRSRSSAPLVRNRNSFSASTSALHTKAVSPTRYGAAAKNKKRNDVISEKYPADMTNSQYEVDLRQQDFQNNIEGFDSSQFVSTLQRLPSDVPESSASFELPALNVPLKADTQYVPVPETLMSPELRPLGATSFSSQQIMFSSCSDALPVAGYDVRPKWAQRSAIPRSTFATSPSSRQTTESRPCRSGGGARNSATDSPILKRPTQVQRLQKPSRPVSLSPSCGRKSPPAKKAAAASAPPDESYGSGSSDDSTDSDVSLSKLLLVKEVAQSKMEAIVRRNVMSTSMEERKARSGDSSMQGSMTASMILGEEGPTERKRELESGVLKDTEKAEKAAIVIQANWKGFKTRNLDQRAVEARKEMRFRRAEDHVMALREQLAKTQAELEGEKKLRILQMEAIRALWKEVQQLQSTHLNGAEVDGGIDGRAPNKSECGLNVQHSSSELAQTKEETKEMPKSLTSSEEVGKKVSIVSDAAFDDTRGDESVKNSPDIQREILGGSGATAKMVSHLLDTCSSLQNQVQQLQEALRCISGAPAGGPDGWRRVPAEHPGSATVRTRSSSPFTSAEASPLSDERDVTPRSGQGAQQNGFRADPVSDETK